MRKFILVICFILALLISVGLLALPIVLGALFSWYWLFLYSFHLITLVVIGFCCYFAPEKREDIDYD